MKKILIIYIAFILVCCKKESIFDEKGYFGEGTAKINGKEWSGKTGVIKAKKYCEPDSCIAISLVNYNEQGFLRGIITIDQVALKTGKFQFNPSPYNKDTLYRISFGEFADDGDVGSSPHRLMVADPNAYLEIESLNKQTGDIRGNFSKVKLARTDIGVGLFHGTYPDTIYLEEGKFYGKINWGG